MKLRSYCEESTWVEISKLLPENNRITKYNQPEEIYWDWGGNKIHIDYYLNFNSKAKIILLHGVGGNGRLLSFIGAPLHKRGFEVIAPDLPGYGLTQWDGNINYDHWIELVDGLINEEVEKDNRLVFLFGLSAGGMLAYQVRCINKKVSGLIATNILDQRLSAVRDASAINKYMSKIGISVLKFLHLLNKNMKLPMRIVANMNAIVNNEEFLSLLIKDKRSSGASVPISLMLSLISTAPQIEPENFTSCPFLLVHPEKDEWTPVALSLLFYNRLGCNKKLSILENAGHFPIEHPGLTQLEDRIVEFIDEIIEKNCL